MRVSGQGFAPITINDTLDAESIDDIMDGDVIEDSGLGPKLAELEGKVEADQVDHLAFEVHRLGPAPKRVPKKRRG